MPSRRNKMGFDLEGTDGTRYQVKGRQEGTLNIDINNFEFDYVVLVNLSDDFRPSGMWKMSMDSIRSLCAERGKFRKFQLTQRAFKQAAVPIDIGPLRTALMHSVA